MKARVAATSTSAAARNAGSVIPMFSSESRPSEETLEVVISGPVTDNVNLSKDRDQPMLHVKLATKEWEFDQEYVEDESREC